VELILGEAKELIKLIRPIKITSTNKNLGILKANNLKLAAKLEEVEPSISQRANEK
jgi:hypothetical protein